MNKLGKRALSLLLSLVMLLSLLPTSVLAAPSDRDALICGLSEHTHTAGCYAVESALTCQEQEGHWHGGDCYIPGELACGLDEAEGHTHDSGCYAPAELICQVEEDHWHDDSCYEEREVLVCKEQEHTHTGSCYADEHDYASVDDFMDAIAAFGEVTDADENERALDRCDDIYARLSPEDQAAMAEYYQALQAYRRNPNEGVGTLDLFDPDTSVVTFQFLDADGERLYLENESDDAPYMLKAGETLEYPAAPEKAWTAGNPHSVFDHWEATCEDKDVTLPEGTLAPAFASEYDGRTIEVRPAYNEYWHVSFKGADNEVCYIAQVSLNETLSETQLAEAETAYARTKPGFVPKKWTYDLEGFTGTQPVTRDITAHVAAGDATEGVWVSFEPNGGSFVADVQPDANGTVDSLSTPEKAGYTFAGWYKDAALTDGPVTELTNVTASVTLYAKWTPQTVSYTVIYWVENANWENPDASKRDSQQYASFGTERKDDGLAGSKPVWDHTKLPNGGLGDSKGQGFFLNEEKSNVDTTIAGDGTTIVNVYYDRYTYDIYFRSSSETTCNNRYHRHSTECYRLLNTVTAKYGADISGLWPTNPGNTTSWLNYRPGTMSSNGAYRTFMEVMPLNGQFKDTSNNVRDSGTYWYDAQSGDPYTRIFYIEALPGDTVDRTVNGVGYTEYRRVTIYAGSAGLAAWIPLEGCRPQAGGDTSWQNEGSRWDPDYYARGYYLRESYNLEYVVPGNPKLNHTESVKYGAPIISTEHPLYKPAIEDFNGWYLDEACTQAADLTGTMPAKGVTVYAGRKTTSSTVTVQEADGTDSFIITVPAGTVVNTKEALAELVKKANPDFDDTNILGFYEGANLIRFATTFDHNVTLTVARKDASYNLSYSENGGEAVKDTTVSYPLNTTAPVKSPDKMTNSAGETFDYWTSNLDDNGKKYYPNDLIVVTPNTVLTAHYQKVTVSLVDITYHANYTVGEGTSSELILGTRVANNSKVPVSEPNHVWDEEQEANGYKFLGWATSANGEVVYEIGDTIGLDKENMASANQLWAVWGEKEYTITYKDGETEITPQLTPATYKVTTPTITLPTPPAKANHQFLGWKDAAGNDVTAIPVGSTGDKVLYAQWKTLLYGHTVKYRYQDGSAAPVVGNAPVVNGNTAPTTVAPDEASNKYAVGTKTTFELGAAFTKVTVDGKTYALDTIDQVIITGNAGTDDVVVTYATDEKGGTPENPGDGIPDKYQVTVQYESADPNKGTVTSSEETLTIRNEEGQLAVRGTVYTVPERSDPRADAKATYKFTKWTAPAAVGFSTSWEKGEFTENSITTPIELRGVTGGSVYTFKAHFELDTYTVVYEPNGGTWTSTTELTDGKYQETVSAEATVNTGTASSKISYQDYNFAGWTYTAKDATEATVYTGNMTPVALAEAIGTRDNTITLTAKWEQKYQIIQHFVVPNDEGITIDGEGDILTLANGQTLDGVVSFYERNYQAGDKSVDERLTLTQQYIWDKDRTETELKIKDGSNVNVIHLYYDVDCWSAKPEDKENPDKTPDGIPDKYQVLVLFESADTTKGEVTGTGTKQVFTVEGDGVVDVIPVKTDITVTPNTGYAFDIWTKDNGTSAVNPFTNQTGVSGGDTIVFKANFAEDTKSDPTKDTNPEKPGDGIPDKYQAEVTYKIEHGYFGMVQNEKNEWVPETEKTYLLTLKELDAESGEWKNVEYDMHIPADGEMTANYGYTKDNWSGKAPEKADVYPGAKLTYTYVCKENALTYQVKYYVYGPTDVSLDNGSHDSEVLTADAGVKEIEWADIQDTYKIEVKGYVFHSVEFETLKLSTTRENVIKVFYAVDVKGGTPEEPGDGIPDEYQAEVTYKIEDGYFGMVQNEKNEWVPETEKTYLLTLKELDAESGKWTDVEYDMHIPADGEMTANYGYTKDNWSGKAPEKADVYPGAKLTYTYVCKENALTYQVKYYVYGPTDVSLDNGSHDSKVLTADAGVKEIEWADIQDTYKIKVKGYVFHSVEFETLKLSTTRENVIKVFYAVDVKGGTPEEPGDGIPDEYQATVTYKVENGTWQDMGNATTKEVFFTLKEKKDGNWVDVTPKPTLGNTIPSGVPGEDMQETGSWSQETPKTDTAVTGDVTYTLTYTRLGERTITVIYVDERGNTIGSGSTITAFEGRPGQVTAADVAGTVDVGDNHYILADTLPKTVAADVNTVSVRYALDNWNQPGNSLTGGDGIPDSQQAVVYYTSSNSEYGTVTGDAWQVHTLSTQGTITLRNTASTTSLSRTRFNSWSHNGTTLNSNGTTLNATLSVIGGSTYYVMANFSRGTGGGGTSGGGTGGGGGGGTGGGTTIDDGEVPLAGDLQLNKEDHFAYIKGYTDGTVRPNNPLTRAQVATIFYRLLDEMSRTIYFQETNDFSDVADTFWANKAISTLTNAGIITGFQDGTFRPNAYITRAQFAAIAARFDDVVPGLENPYTDVAEDYWARDLIAYAADRGWITGQGGKFRPLENITRVEAMDFINNVLDRHVDKDGLLDGATYWSDVKEGDSYYYVVLEATNTHDFERRTEGELMENWTALREDPVWDE